VPRTAPAGSTTGTLVHNGVVRSYQLDIPASYNGWRSIPVIVNLHGAGSNPQRQNDQTRMPELAGRQGYVVVAPQAAGSTWNLVPAFVGAPDVGPGVPVPTGDDAGFVNALMDHLESTLCLDKSREYVTGMSAGAGMATWLMCQPDTRFAAAAPVAGLTQGLFCPAPSVPPFITFHGDADPAVPYGGGNLAGLPLGIPSVEGRTNEFALKEGCTTQVRTTRIAANVEHKVWQCPPWAAAEVYKIIGGGHVWPGSVGNQSIDATRVILSFFAQHRL
jgi:polyhydroxybutyrate depolymerase